MPDRAPPATVYQLRAVVHGVSPLIWRRLLVPGDTTIAVLHAIVQAAFGWSGEHLHYFTVLRHLLRRRTGFPRRRPPGPPGRPGTARGRAVHYTYNFFADWRLDLRVEQITAIHSEGYPRCVGGRRAGPPEEWDGPWEYLERTQPHLVIDAAVRAAEILRGLLDADPDEDVRGFLETTTTSWPVCSRCCASTASTAAP